VADFQNLYDQYRINYIKMYIVARTVMPTAYESWSTYAIGAPELVGVIDYDDAITPPPTPAGMNEIREFGRCKSFCFTNEKRVWRVGWRPSIKTNDNRVLSKQWVDMTDILKQHFGLKLVLRIPYNGTLTFPGQMEFDVYATYYFSCKGTR
jgi:hypothetical protein